MRLILLRHAQAVERSSSDFARRLTLRGREQSAHVGCFLRDHGLRPTHILCSPYLRARETAAVVCAQLQLPDATIPTPGIVDSPQDEAALALLCEDTVLGCGMRPEAALGLLRHLPEEDTVLLVGHQPDCGIFSAFLTGTPNNYAFNFRKACSAVFEVNRFCGGGGTLEAFIPVKFV